MAIRINNLTIKIDSIWVTYTQKKMDRNKFGMTFLVLTISSLKKLRVVWPTKPHPERNVLGGPF